MNSQPERGNTITRVQPESGSDFALNRGARRRMKKALGLSHTPSRFQTQGLIKAGYKEDEPIKVRVPRAKFGNES